MFGSLGFPEILLILVLALLIFGPKRLPEVGRTLGKGLSEFRRASTDLKRTVNAELSLDEDERPPTSRRPEIGPTSAEPSAPGGLASPAATAPRPVESPASEPPAAAEATPPPAPAEEKPASAEAEPHEEPAEEPAPTTTH